MIVGDRSRRSRARRAAGSTSFTCTTPTMSSRSVPYTGKRLKPVSSDARDRGRRRCRRGRWRVDVDTRGTSASAAVLSLKRSVRVSSVNASGSSVPSSPDDRIEQLELFERCAPTPAPPAARCRAGAPSSWPPVEQPDQRAEDRRRRSRIGGASHAAPPSPGGRWRGSSGSARRRTIDDDGDEHERERDRHAVAPLADDAPAARSALGHRRLGDEAEHQRRDGDAELRAGEVERQPAQRSGRRSAPAAALRGQALDPVRSTATNANSAATKKPVARMRSRTASRPSAVSIAGLRTVVRPG